MHLTPLLPMLTILALARAENFDPAKNICPRGQLWIRRASDSKKMGCVSLAGGLAKPVAPKDDLPMIAQLVGFKRTGCGLFDVGYDPVVGSNEIYLTRRVTDGVRFCSAVSGGKLGCNVQKRGNGRVRGEATWSTGENRMMIGGVTQFDLNSAGQLVLNRGGQFYVGCGQ